VSLTLFAENLLEPSPSGAFGGSTVTASVGDLYPLARLYDREHGPQYVPGFPQAWAPFYDIIPLPIALDGVALAQLDIDIDVGSNKSVSAWALVNHNITGVTVTLFGDTTFPPTTSRDSLNPLATTFLRTFTPVSLRYWRLRIPAMGFAPPQIGECMLGVPHTITQNPILESAAPAIVGNVARDRTPAGYPRKAKRGASRVRLAYRWNYIVAGTDHAALAAVYALIDEGAKNLLVKDEDGVVRWMEVTDAEVSPVPVVNNPVVGSEVLSSRLTLEEIPL